MADLNVYIDNGNGGDGTIGDPYNAFSDINWSTGEANSVYDTIDGGDSVFINLKKDAEWREKLTIGTDGASGHPITIQAYGSGADPIINGAGLITPGSSWSVEAGGGGWQTAYDPTLDTTFSTAARNYRLIIAADTSSYSGTKVRLTLKASAEGSFTFDGVSIGLMTSNDDFDSAPTRVEWNTGDPGATITAGNTLVSDEMTFTFTKTSRYGIHFYCADRLNGQFKDAGQDCYWDLGGADNTLTQSISYTLEGTQDTMIDLLEVETGESYENIWKATLTTEPEIVFMDGTTGEKQASIGACTSEYDWYWDSNLLYIFSETDPDTAYISPGVETGARDQCIYASAKSYFDLDGLELKYSNDPGIQLDGDTNYFNFTDLTVHHNYEVGININSSSCDYGVVDSCTIYNCGWGYAASGVRVQGNNHEIKDNTIYNIGAESTSDDGRGITTNTVTASSIHGNTIYDCGDAGDGMGIEVYETTTTDIYQNLIYDCYGLMELSYNADNNNIYYNIFYGAGGYSAIDIGTESSVSTGNDFYNNVIDCNGKYGFLISYTGNTFKNNIIYNVDGAYYAIWLLERSFGTFDYNCYETNGSGDVAHDEESGGREYTLAEWQSASSQDANSIDDDPLFIDAANDKFSLQSGSPCRDTGVDVSLTTDYLGNSIPMNTDFDIGAYEYLIISPTTQSVAWSVPDPVIVAEIGTVNALVAPDAVVGITSVQEPLIYTEQSANIYIQTIPSIGITVLGAVVVTTSENLLGGGYSMSMEMGLS